MEIISYSRIVGVLGAAARLDENCCSLIFDSNSGELLAWNGGAANINGSDAVTWAAALYGLWANQSDAAGQHDDELKVLIFYNEDRVNCMAQVKPLDRKSSRDRTDRNDGCTLAIIGPQTIQLGALKRCCQQMANGLQPVLYEISSSANSGASSRKK